MTYEERIRDFIIIYENTGKDNKPALLIPDIYRDSYFEEKTETTIL